MDAPRWLDAVADLLRRRAGAPGLRKAIEQPRWRSFNLKAYHDKVLS